MDEDTLLQFDDIDKCLRDIIYSIKRPEHMLLDLDSTLFGTYGSQEGEGFNFHYQAHGYHPLLCYDGLTGYLLKAELRGDSGFSSPRLYKICEMNGCSYAIRLKQNSSLLALLPIKRKTCTKRPKKIRSVMR